MHLPKCVMWCFLAKSFGIYPGLKWWWVDSWVAVTTQESVLKGHWINPYDVVPHKAQLQVILSYPTSTNHWADFGSPPFLGKKEIAGIKEHKNWAVKQALFLGLVWDQVCVAYKHKQQKKIPPNGLASNALLPAATAAKRGKWTARGKIAEASPGPLMAYKPHNFVGHGPKQALRCALHMGLRTGLAHVVISVVKLRERDFPH